MVDDGVAFVGGVGGGNADVEFVFLAGHTPRHDEKAKEDEEDVHHGGDLEGHDGRFAAFSESHGMRGVRSGFVGGEVIAAALGCDGEEADDVGCGAFHFGDEGLGAISEEGVQGCRDDGEDETCCGGDEGFGDAAGEENIAGEAWGPAA